jgi:hypothetical protein
MADYLKSSYADLAADNAYPKGATGGPVRVVSTATTLDASDETVHFNGATSGTVIPATLPNPTTCTGRKYNLNSIQGSIALTVIGGSSVFDGMTAVDTIGHTQKLIIQSDGVLWRSLTPRDLLPVNHSAPIFEDFTTWITSAQPQCQATVSGTGSSVSQFTPNAAANPGIAQLSTGTIATGRADVGSHLNSFSFGGGATTFWGRMQLPTLSNATQRYQCVMGFRGNNTLINQTNAAYFLYDEGGVSTGSVASPNWILVTCSNGIRTFTPTTIPVDANWIDQHPTA